MGEIAEDMIDGSACQFCGCYFQHPNGVGIYTHDHPVVCWDCWEDLSSVERKEYVKSNVETF